MLAHKNRSGVASSKILDVKINLTCKHRQDVVEGSHLRARAMASSVLSMLGLRLGLLQQAVRTTIFLSLATHSHRQAQEILIP